MAHQYFVSGILTAGQEARPVNFEAALDREIHTLGMIRAIEERVSASLAGAFCVISFNYLRQDSEQGLTDDVDSIRIRL